jgi:acetyltransferase-like isoleucine patch superfamily enzyme
MKLSTAFKMPFYIFRDVLFILLVYTPGPTGIILRRLYYQKKLKSCGKNLVVDVGVSIDGTDLITVGDDVFIDKYCIISTDLATQGVVTERKNSDYAYCKAELIIGSNVHICQGCIIMAYGGVEISDNCVMSAATKIYSLTNLANHPDDKGRVISIQPYSQAPFLLSPVVLKQNVWLGLQVIVMPGVTVGKNSFAASNSVLMGKFPENAYMVGQPAKVIRERFSKSDRSID